MNYTILQLKLTMTDDVRWWWTPSVGKLFRMIQFTEINRSLSHLMIS